jgi:hypothetical protein
VADRTAPTPNVFVFFVCQPAAPAPYVATEASGRATRSASIAAGFRKRPHRMTRAEQVAAESSAFGLIPKR